MKTILIFERESSTINLLKQMFEAVNCQPSVILHCNSYSDIPKDEIVAMFINIEMPGINIAKIVDYFNEPGKPELPIYFLVSQKRIELYEKLKNVKHKGKLIKPFKLEEIYYLLETPLSLNKISLNEFDLHYKYKKFVEYKNEIHDWLNSFKTLVQK